MNLIDALLSGSLRPAQTRRPVAPPRAPRRDSPVGGRPGYSSITSEELARLEKNYQNYKKSKTKGRGGTLTSLISEGGAVGGALVGQAAIPIPFVGAAIGAGIGGTLGRGLENKVRDDQNFLGEGGSAKAALGEGALSAALGGIPIGGAATKASKAASPAINKGLTGKMQIAGQRLESRAGGYGQGVKLPGRGRLTPSEVDKMKALDLKEKIPAGHPDIQGKFIESKLAEANKQLDDVIKKSNRTLTKQEQLSIPAQIKAGVNGNRAIRGDSNVIRETNQLVKSHKDIKTLEDAVRAKRDLQKEINFSRNSQSAVPGKEQANKIALQVLDDFISRANPSIGSVNKRVSQLIQRQELSLAESAKLTSQSTNAGAGFYGRAVTGDTAQTVKSKLGNAIQKVSGGAASGGRLPAGTVTETLKQGAGRQLYNMNNGTTEAPVQDMSFGPQTAEEVAAAQANPDLYATDNLGPGMAAGGGTPEAPQQALTLPEALAQAQQLIGGNEKPSVYLDYAKELMKSSGGAGGSPNITKVTAQQYGLAQTGRQSLANLAGLLQEDPGVLGRSATPGRKLPIVGGYVSEAVKTGDFDAIGYNIADTLLRIRTGATANESEVRNLQSQIMPRAGDSPQTVQTKLRQLDEAFNSILANAQAGGVGESPLDDIAQLQGAY